MEKFVTKLSRFKYVGLPDNNPKPSTSKPMVIETETAVSESISPISQIIENTISSGVDDVDSDSKILKKSYKQKLKREWSEHPNLKSWILPSKDNKNRPYSFL